MIFVYISNNLIGLFVSILIMLIVLIIKKWKGQPITGYEKRDRRFINKNSGRYDQPQKPWINTESKLYIWMHKVISKIALPNYLKGKCQQFVKREETSKQFTNKPHTEEKKLGKNSFFKSEKPK